MIERAIHFVGSIPGETAEEVIRDSLRRAGPGLRCITDGETGERRNWITHIVDSFRTHPGFELHRDGDWSSYDKVPIFRLRRGHRLVADELQMGQDAWFEQSYPVFRRVRAELGYEGLAFQVGIAGDLDLSLFTFGPGGAFQHRRPFAQALIRTIRRVHMVAGSDVIFQIEIPAELIFVAKVPALLRPAMAAVLSRGVVKLAAAAPEGARFGVHLCLGDLGHKALGRLRDTRPLVHLANALAAHWPARRPLEYIHAPLAAGETPAPLKPAFYTPLARLRLPAETRFVAGFIHEDRNLDELRRTLCLVEDNYGHPVDVASACGLGRRTSAKATACINLARQLRTAEHPTGHSPATPAPTRGQ